MEAMYVEGSLLLDKLIGAETTISVPCVLALSLQPFNHPHVCFMLYVCAFMLNSPIILLVIYLANVCPSKHIIDAGSAEN